MYSPIFQYRCAEQAFTESKYSVAKTCYNEVLKNCHIPSHLSLLATCGTLDAMLASDDWTSANAFVDGHNFLPLKSIFGYDDLLIRECFLLVKNNHFVAAKKLLSRVNFSYLSQDDRIWYHLLRALIFYDDSHISDAEAEFSLAKACTSNSEQTALIEAFELQCEVSNLTTNTDKPRLIQSLQKKIEKYKYSKQSLPFFKQYVLLFNALGKNRGTQDLIEDFLCYAEHINDLCDVRLYRALANGVLSNSGQTDIKFVLQSFCSKRVKLLALKLIICAAKTETDAQTAIVLLNDVIDEALPEWIIRNIYLAKIAILVAIEQFDQCQQIASAYIKNFPRDKYFDELYELLAYIALDYDAKEYRLFAHYLDKLRSLSGDINTRLAISTKIADAFFYNRDFKLASDMYGEVLKFDQSMKFRYVLVRQILSDIALKDYANARKHIELAGDFHSEKCEAIIKYLSALKDDKLYDKALRYIDSINLDSIQQLFRFQILLCKSQILYAHKQYSQALLLSSKICKFLRSDVNAEDFSELLANALFINGCAAYKLKDIASAKDAFEKLRTNFASTEYATLSYIKEAKFLYESKNPEQAITLLKKCTDGRYVHYIHYKIAEITRSTGDLRSAIRLFEKFINEYPNSKFSVLARIAQCDTLRMLGDFSSARAIYEKLLSDAHDDRQQKYILLARAKCLLAQSRKNVSALDGAIIDLESLYASSFPDLEFRLEVAAEYCLALKLSSNYETTKDIALGTLKNIFSSNENLSKKATHWVLQILFILRDIYDLSQEQSDDVDYVTSLIKKYQITKNHD